MEIDLYKTSLLLAGVLLAAPGLWLLIVSRPGRSHPVLRAPCVGIISSVSMLVIGLGCLGVAYHLAVEALGLNAFRAPLWAACAIAIGAVVLSLLTDGIENRRDGG